MAKHTGEKILGPNISVLVFLTAMLITAVTGTTRAKSLYVIADIDGRPTIPVQAYRIGTDGTLIFQAEHGIPRYNFGAVGLAIDSDSKTLFVSYEESNTIQLIDAKMMTSIGTTRAPGARNLAGIVYDFKKRLLYCVDRNTEKLYVYDWNVSTATLTQVPGSPFTLTGAAAFGIALDAINDLLYVANNRTTINVYHTSDWSSAATISVSRIAVSVAIDAMRGFLYLGGGFVAEGDYATRYNPYLTQYNLNTNMEKEVQVEPDAGVIGLARDPVTGFVYVTTGRNNQPGGDNIRVYDTALNLIDVVAIDGSPTGLVVPRKDIGYNPLYLSKDIVWSAMDEAESVPIGGTIIYNICFGNTSIEHNVNNVSIIDTLPEEVIFITADGDGVFGQYDPITHTYLWSYPSLPPDSPGDCLQLTVQVKQDTASGTIISNSATIESDETEPLTASVDVTATGKAISYNPLNLSKNIIGGTIEQDPVSKVGSVSIGDTIIYDICFDNNDNDYTVNNVSIFDTLPDEVSFVTADGDGIFGQYDPVTHTYTWTYPFLPPRFPGDCLQLEVQVNESAVPGTTITNSVTIDSGETEPTKASIDVVTEAIHYNPLNLSKNIIGGTIEQNGTGKETYVVVGDTIIYGICFDNKDNDYTVTNVSIVDALPDEVSFLTADGDGVFGQYDPITHTYRWSYSSLEPGFPGTCLTLVVQVNQAAIPGTTITNSVTINSDKTEPAIASVDVITKAISYNPLNLSKNIIGGTIEQTAISDLSSVEVGGTIIYGICFDNKGNDYTVTNVSIVDNLPYEVSFVKADGDGVFGHYDAITHTYRWYYPSLPPGFPGACLNLVVQVNQGTVQGTAITNSVTISSDETAPATARVDVVTHRSPLEATLTVRPNMIRRDGCCDRILAIVGLPQGIGRDDIEDEPLILNPGGIAASSQLVFGTADRAEVRAWFDTCELMAAVSGYGEVRVQVTGKLKSGQSFIGEDIIYITRFTGS